MKNPYYSPCPVETALNLIGNKWKLLIIAKLMEKKMRFGELKMAIMATKNQKISQNVLTQNLRELMAAKIISRRAFACVPPKVEYSLTPLGASLQGIIKSLENWGQNYQNSLKISGENSAKNLGELSPQIAQNLSENSPNHTKNLGEISPVKTTAKKAQKCSQKSL